MEKIKVAIIDDDENILNLTKAVLEKKGYEAHTFNSGPKALEGIRESLPNLILLDLGMPGMDGFEVFEKLRGDKTTAAIPVIMLTAHGRDREIAKARKLGLDDYIVKPFVPGNLMAFIQKALAR